jgi:uncharacterized membrane protein (UPF0127 family)
MWGCNGGSRSPADTQPSTPAVTGAGSDDTQNDEPPKPKPEGDPQPTLPLGTVELEIPGRQHVKLGVEVASTRAETQAGLMFRESLAPDAGMLFIFPIQRHQSFWMKNTLIPLDMFFISSSWEVVGVVENAEPLTEVPREVDGDSQYVLEVNAGFAKKHGFGPGTKVRYTPPETSH